AGFAAGLCSAARTCGPGDVGVLVGVVAGVTGVEPACPNAATSNVRTIGTPATTTPATAPRRKNSRRVCRSILPAPRPRAGESTRKSPKWTDRRRGTRCRDRGTGVVPAVARGHAMSPRDASRLLPRERARPRDVRDDAAGADERLARVAEDGHELPVVHLQERAAAERVVLVGVLTGPVDRTDQPTGVVAGQLVERVDDLLAGEARSCAAQAGHELVGVDPADQRVLVLRVAALVHPLDEALQRGELRAGLERGLLDEDDRALEEPRVAGHELGVVRVREEHLRVQALLAHLTGERQHAVRVHARRDEVDLRVAHLLHVRAEVRDAEREALVGEDD